MLYNIKQKMILGGKAMIKNLSKTNKVLITLCEAKNYKLTKTQIIMLEIILVILMLLLMRCTIVRIEKSIKIDKKVEIEKKH